MGPSTILTILFDTAHVYYNFRGKESEPERSLGWFMVSRLPAPSYSRPSRSFCYSGRYARFYRQWQLANEANDQVFRLKVVELAVTVKKPHQDPRTAA